MGAAPRKHETLKLPKTVVLIGLMGAGKSTIGRKLAKHLGVSFLDSDQEIVDAAGCSISDIFAIHGEEIFRDLEHRVIIRLLGNEPFVLATGGGAFMSEAIQEAIRESAISVWLRADVNVLLDRVSRRSHRPLLEMGDKRDILQKLMEDRYPIYQEANIIVDSGQGSQDNVVQNIIAQLKHHQDKSA